MAQAALPTRSLSTSSLIRAMAQTLYDHGVNPLNDVEVTLALTRAGWPVKAIVENYDAVQAMATIRKTNEERGYGQCKYRNG